VLIGIGERQRIVERPPPRIAIKGI
jgi:hypothetical protein